MLEYTKAPFSSKTMISLWLFITIYWILWVLNSQRLYTQEGWVCFLVRALSDRFSLWGFFYPHPLSKEAYPCIYPLCFIPWGMGGKVCSGQGIYFALRCSSFPPLWWGGLGLSSLGYADTFAELTNVGEVGWESRVNFHGSHRAQFSPLAFLPRSQSIVCISTVSRLPFFHCVTTLRWDYTNSQELFSEHTS